jgi:preprotein translocase subunit SecB
VAIDGVAPDQMHPFLLIEVPRQAFPWVQRIVADLTRDGGFPPLRLEQIDFLALYRQEIARRVRKPAAGDAQADAQPTS